MQIRQLAASIALLALVVAGAATPLAKDRKAQRRSEFKGQAVASSTAPDHLVQKFRVVAADGKITPDQFRVKRFKQVRIVFVSKDGDYGIRFKEFGIKRKLTPEKPVIVDLMPTEPGPFEFRCAKKWGLKRWSNNGTMIVY